MRERVAAISGSLQLETEPGSGCRIIVKIPWQHHPEQMGRNLSDAQSLTLESYS
jgi:glucose-6-phosphate-specific signal transduction histidine kinase